MFVSNKSSILLKPGLKSGLDIEFNSCLSRLKEALTDRQLSSDRVLKQTVFLNANNHSEYREQKAFLTKRLQEFYGSLIPPTSFIAQPPDDQQQCVLELILLKSDSAGTEVQRKKIDGITYSVLYYPKTGTKEVFAGGLTSASDAYKPCQCSYYAFEVMERILKAENLSFANIVRQWNYIEGILDKKKEKDGIRQNYQVFNDVRSRYYQKSTFNKGYPAATGIGMNTGGIILEFLAVNNTKNVNIIPITNPLQVNAYSYSDEVLVGKPIEEIPQKTSPKFERAKFLAIDNIAQVFISGTAAIHGEETVSDQDAANQTKTTIENIQELVGKPNLARHRIFQNSCPPKLSHLRVYVKRETDLKDVKAVCGKYYPNVSALYLLSDICRDDLLVEIEGVLDM